MTPDPGPGEEPADGFDGVLPERVRARLVALASERLGALGDEEVPPGLRHFRRFTPSRRERLAGTALAVALARDPGFRQRVAMAVRETQPELAAALDEGTLPAAVDPCETAAAAYLLRPPGGERLLVTAAAQVERARDSADSAHHVEALTRLQEQLSALRAQARADLDRLRADLEASRAEAGELRRALREARDAAAKAGTRAEEAGAEAARHRTQAAAAGAGAEAELRRLRARLASAEAAAETARRTVREGRALADARLRLLLDTVVEATQGLRRELALPPAALRPADVVDAVEPGGAGVDHVPQRAAAPDDPGLLDRLLTLPQVHLVVDGYNVTKAGYGGLPLETQRARLVAGLAALAARSGAEVTCCFDGVDLPGPLVMTTPRGVRVLFSRQGETADELIRRLVRNEPPGRPVVVVSSDREVAEGVALAGARAVPSAALLRRLDRG